MTVYRVTEPVTLNGEPAGPNEAEYLEFVAGDLVVSVDDAGWGERPDGVVVVREVNGSLEQELDRSSLVEVTEQLTLFDLDEIHDYVHEEDNDE